MIRTKDECRATKKQQQLDFRGMDGTFILKSKALESWSTACPTLLNIQLIWRGQIISISLMRLTIVNSIATTVQTEI